MPVYESPTAAFHKHYRILYFVSGKGETEVGEHFRTIGAASKVAKYMMRGETKWAANGDSIAATYTIIDQSSQVVKRWVISKIQYKEI